MTFEDGKAVYKDLIEEGMLKRIEEINPIKACQLRIERYKRLLDEEEAKLANLQLLDKMSKLDPKKKKRTIDPKIETMRLTKFNQLKPNLASQVRRGNADWGKIAEVFVFDSTSEARDWTITKLQEECLID